MENLSIYQKLHEARKYIKTLDAEKQGQNEHFKFNYFTPEQVSQLVFQACNSQKIIPLFSLKKNEFGHYGILIIQDLESDQKIEFEMSTGIPEIRAANITQQLGGAVTYTERYLLMAAFDIKDNNLDPDNTMKKPEAKENTPETEKKWLNKWTDKEHQRIGTDYQKIVAGAKERGMNADDLKEYYKISKEIQQELEIDLKA